MIPTTSNARARHRRPRGSAGPVRPPRLPRQRRPRRPTESRRRTWALIGAAALALVVALVLAWPQKAAPPSSLSAPTHHRAPSTPPTTAHNRPVPTSTTPSTTAPPTSTVPTNTVPLSSLSPGSLSGSEGTSTGLTTDDTQPPATPGVAHAATPAQKSAISGAVTNPPGPIGDVFVSASDPSYAAVEFGGSQLAYALMENENGTWTQLAEGSPQIPCTTSTEYGLPEQVKSDFSGMMQPCG
jgi:hypothetical protein